VGVGGPPQISCAAERIRKWHMRQCCLLLLALRASVLHGWSTAQLHVPARAAVNLRARPVLMQLEPDPVDDDGLNGMTVNARGEEVAKKDGIPEYCFRTSGNISRVAEKSDSSTAAGDDGVLYEADRLVSIVTSDVIEMVQQQGGAAEDVDYLGEDMLVEGLLFDSFKAGNVFEIASAEKLGSESDAVTMEVVEERDSSSVELGQLGDDDAKRQSITSLLSLSPGLAGWVARVVVPGRVCADFKIAKREDPEGE
jgi:hypothetical protein